MCATQHCHCFPQKHSHHIRRWRKVSSEKKWILCIAVSNLYSSFKASTYYVTSNNLQLGLFVSSSTCSILYSKDCLMETTQAFCSFSLIWTVLKKSSRNPGYLEHALLSLNLHICHTHGVIGPNKQAAAWYLTVLFTVSF